MNLLIYLNVPATSHPTLITSTFPIHRWWYSVLSKSLWPHGLYLPNSSHHGIYQARILDWVNISYSRGSSWTRDGSQVSHISCTGRQILYHCAAWEAHPDTVYSLQIYHWRIDYLFICLQGYWTFLLSHSNFSVAH